jgi:hypothetical protein
MRPSLSTRRRRDAGAWQWRRPATRRDSSSDSSSSSCSYLHPPPPPLTCFIASHVESEARVTELGRMLASIATQTASALPAVHMSWSSSSVLADAVRTQLAASAFPGLDAIEQPGRLSQFEHLRELTRRAEEGPAPPWVFFSDDDDLWSERRHALFARACARAKPSTVAVVCTRKARPAGAATAADGGGDDDGGSTVDDGSDGEGGCPRASSAAVRTAADVRAQLRAGSALLTDLCALDMSKESFNMDEYFDYAVRFEALRGFFASVPPVVIRHKLCDLAFVGILHQSPTERFTPDEADEFVYWYARADNAPFADNAAAAAAVSACAGRGSGGNRRGDGGGGSTGASSGVDIGDAERSLAKSSMPTVAAILAEAPEEAPEMDEATLAFFLSSLRQGMEQELVQLRVRSASPKLSVTSQVCERQLDVILSDHPMRGSRCYRKFRAWALESAKGPLLNGLLRALCFDLPRSRGGSCRR